MIFIKLIFLEGALCLAAGIIFMAGARGIGIAAFILSILSVIQGFSNHWSNFWRYEMYLGVGCIVGLLVLYFFNRQAKEHHMVMGLTGGLISLVLFGAFFSPLGALVLWAMVIGAGLLPQEKRSSLLWGASPTVWRCLLGIGAIVYGNAIF